MRIRCVRQRELSSHISKVEGEAVQTVMHQAVSVENGFSPGLAESYARSGYPLKLDGKGGAVFADGGRLLQNRTSNGSLSSALDQLHARRQRNAGSQERRSMQKQKSGAIATFSMTDKRYYRGEVSEAALYGGHRTRALGEAQSFGSLHWM